MAVLPLALETTLPVSAFTLRSRAGSRAITAFIDAARAVNGGGGGSML